MMPVSGVNSIAGRSIYPTFGGPTLGTESSAGTANPVVTSGSGSAKAARAPSEAQIAAYVGAQGSPLIWFGVMVILLLGLMFMAKRIGGEAREFASIKASFYNVLVISLAAIIGINFFKMVFTKVKVPGLSTLILAA